MWPPLPVLSPRCYGTSRLANNVADMTGSRPGWLCRMAWRLMAPGLIAVIWAFTLIDYRWGGGCTPVSLHTHSSRPPSYNKGQYTYPPWVLGLGWGVASLSLAALPLAAAHALLKAGGSPWARLRGALASTITSCPCCGGKLDSQHRVRQGEVVAG